MPSYHDVRDFKDGDVREISAMQYEYLLKTFPENFFPVEVEAEKSALPPEKNRAVTSAKRNK